MLSVAGYTVSPVVVGDLPWLVRVRLRSAQNRGRTGLILWGRIRQGPRSISLQLPYAGIMEGKRRLGTRGPSGHLPKWKSLSPGTHELTFMAGNRLRSSSFVEPVTLNEGDVLVAVCEPVQPNTLFAKSPEADLWSLGIIDSKGHARPVRPAQP
jgi:hypothetical protein